MQKCISEALLQYKARKDRRQHDSVTGGKMKTILFLNQKGGVGKTLLADETAYALERSPYVKSVSFIDLDGQGGTRHISNDAADADVMIIDTPGALQMDTPKWIEGADVVVIPTLTSNYEAAPLGRMLAAASKFPHKKVLIVLNNYEDDEDTREFREQLGSLADRYQICELPHRKDYKKAVNRGQSVVDFKPSSDAARRMVEVTNAIISAAGFKVVDYDKSKLVIRKRNMYFAEKRRQKEMARMERKAKGGKE